MHEQARSGPGALHRESVAYALLTWRTAEQTLRHPFLNDQRPAYERAVAGVLAELRGCGSVADLMAHYAMDRLAVHAATGASGVSGGHDPRLMPALVEGAAFWRRLRELVAERVA